MKSTKKRFKLLLADVEQAASELRLLSSQLALLDDVLQLAENVLRICTVLRRRASELHKSDFAGQMAVEPSLIELDEMVDEDVISALEQRLASACQAGTDAGQLGELLKQLLDKLENRHAAMIENIQRLAALLADAN